MTTELDGFVEEISYRSGGWRVKLELRQDVPCDGGFRVLGIIELHIPEESVDKFIKCGSVKILVEV